MIERTLDTARAQRLYDRIGSRLDVAQSWERSAVSQALAVLDVRPGERVLNAGSGTGLDHARLRLSAAPGGLALALDRSPKLLRLLRQRTGSPATRADIRRIPCADATFDAVYSAYVLDLLAGHDLSTTIGELLRVLRPGGRLVLVSLTPGTTPLSAAISGVWNAVHRVAPALVGGCRPVQLESLVRLEGGASVRRFTLVEYGLTSEVVTATR